MPENTVVTVKMLMDYLSKYPPYLRVVLYKPPYRMGYRVMAPKKGKDNPWMYSTRGIYIPMREVKQFELPPYNTYRSGVDGRSIRHNPRKRKQEHQRRTEQLKDYE